MVLTNNLWQQACRECGYDFVKKGTDEYTIVKKVFDEMKDKNNKKINSSSLNLWQQTCKELGYDFVRKGTEEYRVVKSLYEFNKKHIELSNPSLMLWSRCAEELGYGNQSIRKGSSEYNEIRELFNERRFKKNTKNLYTNQLPANEGLQSNP